MNKVAEDILMHYGMPRRSGRYPWGSGDDPYQHSGRDFLGRIEELKKQGFDLDGIDEELFIQDIEGIDVGNTDYANPAEIFNTLKESGCLDDEDKLKVANAYIEVNGWNDFPTGCKRDICCYKRPSTEYIKTENEHKSE